MNTAVDTPPLKAEVFEVTDDALVAVLEDGRVIMVPIWWYWRLEQASPEQRRHFELHPTRTFVHWPEIDEDIGIEDMVKAGPPPRPHKLPSPNRKPIRWQAGLEWPALPGSIAVMRDLPSLWKAASKVATWSSRQVWWQDSGIFICTVGKSNASRTLLEQIEALVERFHGTGKPAADQESSEDS